MGPTPKEETRVPEIKAAVKESKDRSATEPVYRAEDDPFRFARKYF